MVAVPVMQYAIAYPTPNKLIPGCVSLLLLLQAQRQLQVPGNSARVSIGWGKQLTNNELSAILLAPLAILLSPSCPPYSH